MISIDIWEDYDEPNISSNDANNKIKIFLGQPINEINNKELINKYNDIVKQLKSIRYFPHPKETKIFSNVDYINSNMIAEDYIYHLLKEYNQIYLYTISSTAILNINNKIISKYVIDLAIDFLPIIQFKKIAIQLGCKIINPVNIE